MLLRKNHYLLKGIFVLMCVTSAYGCNDLRRTAPGGREMSERPRLPDNHCPDLGESGPSSGNSAAFTVFPFQASLLESTVAGRHQPFAFIALPTTAYDSIASDLIDNYRLVANTLISKWAEKNTGIVLDLRSTGANTRKADYLINTGSQTFPVVIVWDDAAEDRAARYFKVMETVPGVQAPREALVSDSLLNLLPSFNVNKRDKLEDMKIGKYF